MRRNKPQSPGKIIISDFQSFKTEDTYHRLTFEKFFVVLMILHNINMSFLLVMQLIIDRDVESNPGPTYNIVKLLKASFHQGNEMFGATRGTQCACNALFAICWADDD